MKKEIIIKSIKELYLPNGAGKKRLNHLNILFFFLNVLTIFGAFQLEIFNYEKILFVFLFIGAYTLTLVYSTIYSRSYKLFDITQEILNWVKINNILNNCAEKLMKISLLLFQPKNSLNPLKISYLILKIKNIKIPLKTILGNQLG